MIRPLQLWEPVQKAARRLTRGAHEATRLDRAARIPRISTPSGRSAQNALANAQAEAWEAVMPGCADVAALDPSPADVQHAEGVGAAIARSLAGVMGSAKSPGDSPKKAADGR